MRLIVHAFTLAACLAGVFLNFSCSSSHPILQAAKAKYKGNNSGEMIIHRADVSAYQVDTSFTTYQLRFFQNENPTATQNILFRCQVDFDSGDVVIERIYDGRDCYFVDSDGKVDTFPSLNPFQFNEFLRMIPYFTWPAPYPTGYFATERFNRSKLINSTDQHWIFQRKDLVKSWVRKSDTLIDRIEIYPTTSDQYFARHTIVHQRYWRQDSLDSALVRPSISQDPLAAASESGRTGPRESAQGKLAPDWRLETHEGDTLSLQQLRGKVVLLDFWSAGCKPCIRDLPRHQALQDKFGQDRLQVVGVFVSKSSPEALSRFLALHGVSYPNLLADSAEPQLSQAYGRTFVPMLYLIDENGYVVETVEGSTPAKIAQLERAIERLLEE